MAYVALGATSAVWPTASTHWEGGPPGSTTTFDAQGNATGTVPIDSHGNPIVETRPIAEPSYFWGGEGGRPVYVLADGKDWRPDLWRYDVDGIVKMQGEAPPDPASGAIVPVDPPNVKTTAELNPLTPAMQQQIATETNTALLQADNGLALAGLLLAGLWLLNFKRR